MSLEFAVTGQCTSTAQSPFCALSGNGCSTSDSTATTSFAPNSCGGDVRDVPTGKCVSNGVCAGSARDCTGNTFAPIEPGTQKAECTVGNSFYGRCNQRCSYSASDCKQTETHTPNWPTCTCDKVQIGACRGINNSGDYFCAVDSSACGNTHTFVSVYDLPTSMQCFLCPPGGGGLSQSEKLGIGFGVTIPVLIVLCFFMVIRRRNSKARSLESSAGMHDVEKPAGIPNEDGEDNTEKEVPEIT